MVARGVMPIWTSSRNPDCSRAVVLSLWQTGQDGVRAVAALSFPGRISVWSAVRVNFFRVEKYASCTCLGGVPHPGFCEGGRRCRGGGREPEDGCAERLHANVSQALDQWMDDNLEMTPAGHQDRFTCRSRGGEASSTSSSISLISRTVPSIRASSA